MTYFYFEKVMQRSNLICTLSAEGLCPGNLLGNKYFLFIRALRPLLYFIPTKLISDDVIEEA